jgi:hypothetical protein
MWVPPPGWGPGARSSPPACMHHGRRCPHEKGWRTFGVIVKTSWSGDPGKGLGGSPCVLHFENHWSWVKMKKQAVTLLKIFQYIRKNEKDWSPVLSGGRGVPSYGSDQMHDALGELGRKNLALTSGICKWRDYLCTARVEAEQLPAGGATSWLRHNGRAHPSYLPGLCTHGAATGKHTWISANLEL